MLVLALVPAAVAAQPPAPLPSAAVAEVASLVTTAIAEQELPGAVVLVGRRDGVVLREVWGKRVLEPTPEPMTPVITP